MVGTKFLNFLGNRNNMSDDDYDYDDDYMDSEYDDDDEDDYDEPKRSTVSRISRGSEESRSASASKPIPIASKTSSARGASPSRRPVSTSFPMDICVIKPSGAAEAREISDTLVNNRCIILNLEGLDMDVAQRIIDIISGSCFAIDGNLQKISNCIFLITPKGVNVSGDVLGSPSNSGIHIPDSNY